MADRAAIIEAMCRADFEYHQYAVVLGGRKVTWEMIPERHRQKHRAHMELLLAAADGAGRETFDSAPHDT